MSRSAVVFMVLSWGFVLSLTTWSFVGVMTRGKLNDRNEKQGGPERDDTRNRESEPFAGGSAANEHRQ
jgi:hypothetical protein